MTIVRLLNNEDSSNYFVKTIISVVLEAPKGTFLATRTVTMLSSTEAVWATTLTTNSADTLDVPIAKWSRTSHMFVEVRFVGWSGIIGDGTGWKVRLVG